MNRRDFAKFTAAAALGSAFTPPSALAGTSGAAPATAPFRFSVMLWTIDGKIPFDQSLQDVAAAGYQGVELVNEFTKWSDADIRGIMARMRTLNLTFDSIAGVKTGFADPDAGPALLTELGKQFAIADKLGCRQIILLSGKRLPHAAPGAQHTASIENLKRAGALAAQHKMELVIEPIDNLEQPTIYLTSVAEAFEIVRAVDNPAVRVLYDFYHEQRGAGNLIEKLDGNIDLIGLVHVADVPGRHQPGTGEIDYRNIYRALAQAHYHRFIAMEFYPTGDPVAMLRAARESALQAVA